MDRRTFTLMTAGALAAGLITPIRAMAASELLGDSKGAVPKRMENMRHVRYIELFFAMHDPNTGKLIAPCYNTTFGPSGIPASRDTAPQKLVEALDFDKLAKEYGAINVLLNGPKRWMLDWFEVDVGNTRTFQGIEAPWVAQLNLESPDSLGGAAPYEKVTIDRKSSCAWTKGNKVVLLDDAEGNTWAMKGFEEGLNPKHSYKDFLSEGAGMFKKLPKGWNVRVKVLEKDLIETPENGVATLITDEFFNVYDKTGPGMMNYQP